jgi:L-iditol 2-dehydrogenase
MTAPLVPLEVRRVPAPKPAPGGAILETVASEVCGTDVHLHHGRLSGVPYPIIPGHVSVGRVLEKRGPLNDVEGHDVDVGRLVTFYDVFGTCGTCWHCLVAKAATRCPRRRVWDHDRLEDGLLGGWAEDRGQAGARLPLPEDVTVRIGARLRAPTGIPRGRAGPIALGDGGRAGHGPWAERARLRAARGRLRVLVTRRRAHSGQHGGSPGRARRGRTRDPAARALVRERRGRGADVVIEASGNPQAVVEDLEMLRDSGCLVVVGQYIDGGDVTLNPHRHVNRRHATILGCWGYEYTHLHRSVLMLARHRRRFAWSQLVTREYPLGEASRALADMEALAVVKASSGPA